MVMNLVKKIDSNNSGLRYAQETTIGILPAASSQVWYPLEPNSYPNFGAKTKTVARMPINPSRQILKGTLVDLDPDGGVQNDFTQTGLTRLFQGFWFANINESYDTEAYNGPTADPTLVVGSTHTVTLDYGDNLGSVLAGEIMNLSNFSLGSNNGIFEVASVAHAKATGTFTETSSNNFQNGDILDLGGTTYTFVSPIGVSNGNVLIGSTFANSVANLIEAVTFDNGLGTNEGVNYVGTGADPNIIVSGGVGSFTVTALRYGTAPNSLVTTYTAAATSAGSFGAGTLSGGTSDVVFTAGLANETPPDGARMEVVGFQGASGDLTIVQPGVNVGLPSMQSTVLDFTTLPLFRGQWVWIGGDGASDAFANAANNGWARIRSIAAHVLTFDKTSSEMVNDSGTSKTVQFFWGKFLFNQANPSLQVRRTYTLERTLGNPDQNNPTAPQAEYLVGSVPNEVSFNMTTAEKITCDLTFMSTDYQTIDTTGTILSQVGGASAPAIVSQDAYNTTSHVSRARMTIISASNSANWTDAAPTPMFAELTEFKFNLKNNLKANKAVGKLGPFEITAGFFEGAGSVQAYFSDVDAVQAVRNNADVSIDLALAKDNQGVVFDLPLLTLQSKGLEVKINEPIMLPIDMTMGADRNFNFTASIGFFSYLPTVAMPVVG